MNNLFLVHQFTELDQLLVPKLEPYTGIFYCHFGVKYQPYIDSDESDSDDSVCVDTSHSRSNQPEKVSQAKSVRFQSELPKVGFEDKKGVVSQADSSKVDEDDINLSIPPMESVNQIPDVESGLSDSTGTSEHLVPDDVNLPSQYLVTQSDDS